MRTAVIARAAAEPACSHCGGPVADGSLLVRFVAARVVAAADPGGGALHLPCAVRKHPRRVAAAIAACAEPIPERAELEALLEAALKAETLRRFLEGAHSGAAASAALDSMATMRATELAEVVQLVDLPRVIAAIDDRLRGARLSTLLSDRARELPVPSRAVVVHALNLAAPRPLADRAIEQAILGARGGELTALKNALDTGGGHHDLQEMVFRDLADAGARGRILAHVEVEAASAPSGEVKVLSDIDDTFYASLKDRRFPRGAVYPGVLQFYRELDRGPHEVAGRPGDLTFVTARPQGIAGLFERITRTSLRGRGLPSLVVLSGSFANLLQVGGLERKKLENFRAYRQLYREYRFVFIGDSGQRDIAFGEQLLADPAHDVDAVFIHEVRPARSAQRAQQPQPASARLRFFDTYVGAAVDASALGLVHAGAAERVARAAMEELRAVVFTDAAQARACASLFEQDCRRVGGT